MRVKHDRIRTEKTCVDWIKRYIFHHGKRQPKDMGAQQEGAFLAHLSVAGNVSASTQSQATSALLYLYQEVLGGCPSWVILPRLKCRSVCRWRRIENIPLVVSHGHGNMCFLLSSFQFPRSGVIRRHHLDEKSSTENGYRQACGAA